MDGAALLVTVRSFCPDPQGEVASNPCTSRISAERRKVRRQLLGGEAVGVSAKRTKGLPPIRSKQKRKSVSVGGLKTAAFLQIAATRIFLVVG